MASSSGRCDSRFERVREAFEKNFAERDEVGASVCVTVEGERVVDLWGGVKSRETNEPWAEDTVSLVWSSTKGAAGLCANMLVSRGLLDLDAPVVKYWPGYGQRGKEGTTVAMLLGHQAGVPGLSKRVPPQGFYDWEWMVKALEEQQPDWVPGTRHGYHGFTWGWLVGELVRRVSGKTIGRFFQDEVAGPLGLDFWIGAPEEVEKRLARQIAPTPKGGGLSPSAAGKIVKSKLAMALMPSMLKLTRRFSPERLANTAPFMLTALEDSASMQARMLFNTGGYNTDPGECDSRRAHAAEIPSAGAITNARGLAGMYAPLACGGKSKNVELVDAATLERMSAVISKGPDMILGSETRFTPGFIRSWDNRHQPPNMRETLLLGEHAFGYPGAGGSVGFADTKERVSFGYSLNHMAARMAADARQQSLVDALYLSLGYRSNESGNWTR